MFSHLFRWGPSTKYVFYHNPYPRTLHVELVYRSDLLHQRSDDHLDEELLEFGISFFQGSLSAPCSYRAMTAIELAALDPCISTSFP